jgi:hypothetical protein
VRRVLRPDLEYLVGDEAEPLLRIRSVSRVSDESFAGL